MASQALAPVPATLCPLCKQRCETNDNHEIGCPAGWLGVVNPDQVIPRPADHPSVIRRFFSHTRLSLTRFYKGTACIEWTAGRSRGGDRWSEKAWYGTFNPGGEVKGGVRAHIYSAWLRKLIPSLRVPEGMNIDHRCRNSLCVNSAHFELVPKLVNQQRKYTRG